MIYFICNGVLEQPSSQLLHTTPWQYVNYFMSSNVNVCPPRPRVRSLDCSMFCINKYKHLECYLSSKTPFNRNINICIYLANFYGQMSFCSSRAPCVTYWLGLCAKPLAPWISNALLLDHCYNTRKSVFWLPTVKLLSTWLWKTSFWHSCHFLVLCKGLGKTPRLVTLPG